MNEQDFFEINTNSGECLRGYYSDSGSGPVGIYVHGFMSNADGTKSMYLWENAKRNGRSWLRYDQRGQGRSDGTFEQFRISRVMEDMNCVLEFIGNRPTILVGSSMGGWISAYAALSGKHNVAGLVLIAPAINFIEMIYESFDVEQKLKWDADGKYWFPSDYEEEGFSLDFATIEDARKFDIYHKDVKFDCPVTLLHGELDEVVPLSVSEKLVHASSTDIEMEIVAKGNHRLSDHTDRVQQAVDSIWPV